MSVLLHVCCGPCASSVVERLLEENHEVTLFYYNPNTFPYEEHDERLYNVEKLAKHFKVNVISPIETEEDWNKEHKKWLETIEGLEQEPEGGKRCEVCYKFRLEATAKYAKENGFDKFATTLGIGPMKPIDKINNAGLELAKKYGIKFINENFRKKDGHNRSIVLSRKIKLYRQTYCGCEFSMENQL